MAYDLLFVAEFHRVQVTKAINIIWDNSDFIASLVIQPVRPDSPIYRPVSEHRETSTEDPLQCCVLPIQMSCWYTTICRTRPLSLKRRVGGGENHKKKLVGVVGMPADIRTGHLPKTPAQHYHYTSLLPITRELWSYQHKVKRYQVTIYYKIFLLVVRS
jgi:hypothetical protein